MTDKEIEDLELVIRGIEAQCNQAFADIVETHGPSGAMTALVNLGTAFVAKALVMTPREARDPLMLTIQMLIDSRANEGDAVVESSLVITRAMGSTCRPH